MDKPITIGLDLPKNVFQVDGGYTEGSILCRRRSQMLAFSSRLEPCLVVIEACAGAHDWARKLTAVGHVVRLIGGDKM
ncbi:hypothetical protein IE00_15890 [Paracoccus sp. SM22M-07]|nr:hypothetical protein IE00_15890 [Paracoccus sp. SM22M-07]